VKFLVAFFCVLATWSTAHAEGASFTFLKTVTIAELNAMLTTERDEFLQHASPGNEYQLPTPSTASNDVDLYVVSYSSHSPDLRDDKKMLVSGLLALPRLSSPGSNPLISYQHGTVWGKYEVPSCAFKSTNPDGYPHYGNSYETRYMVALFAGNGYGVMAADYFGMGDAAQFQEAYMIRRNTAQAIYDLYLDVRTHLASQNIGVSKFFLGGWSQGGLNTTGILALLESRGVPVAAAFTASSPNDPFAALNGVFYRPRVGDALWINTILALTVFSCENYMGPKGLAQATIDSDYLEDFEIVYTRRFYPDALMGLLKKWAGTPNLNYLRPEFRDPAFFAASDYGKCLAANETYRQEFKTNIQMFYGSNDEVIRVKVGVLGADYQETLTALPGALSTNNITPILVDGADHRLTFITAAPAARAWMDSLR
jgi:pimeloyl-ACP methyl ester carboxylesterase